MNIAIVGTVSSSMLSFRKPLLLELVRQGHNVYAFAINYDEKSKAEVAKLGVTPIEYDLSRAGLNPVQDLRSMVALYKQFKQLKIELVLNYFVKPVVYGTLAAYFARIKTRVALIEGLGFYFTKQKHEPNFKTKLIKSIQIFLYKMALPKTTKTIFLNPDDKAELTEENKVSVQQAHILGPIGLPLNEYEPSDPVKQPLTFIFIGRLLKEKGIFELLEAAKNIKAKYPDVIFNVLGGTDFDNPGSISRELLDEYNTQGIICYPGYVNNVDEWLQQSSVFILPSYREGFPRSTQEAMAVGRAVITTDVPGCRQTVKEGVNGFIIPPMNASALEEAIIKFIDNPELITQMGSESRKIALSEFDAKIVNKKLISLLLEP